MEENGALIVVEKLNPVADAESEIVEILLVAEEKAEAL